MLARPTDFQSLLEAVQSNNASRVDSDAVGRLLGQEAAMMTRQLQELTRMLEEAGFIQQKQTTVAAATTYQETTSVGHESQGRFGRPR
jgi:uncharacterized protein with von Willebrand factor type A (vWA) domain